MWGLFKRSLKDRRTSLFIYSIASIGFLEMYIALFPTLQKQASEMSKLLDAYPESFFRAFNIDKETLTFQNLGSYLGMEQFNFIWPIMMILLSIGIANYAFANEIEKGTIEVILSQPMSRVKVFLSRYLAGILSLLVFSFVSVAAIFPLAAAHNIEVEAKGIWYLFVLLFIFSFSVFGVAMLGSVIFSEKGKASFLTGGVLIMMYVLNVIAGLKEDLQDLKFFSFFHYYNPTLAMEGLKFVDWALIVFLGVAIAASATALFWFKKRDISV